MAAIVLFGYIMAIINTIIVIANFDKLEELGPVRKSTKDQLSDALMKLLKDQPLNQITVSDIAKECGVSRMTFYYHFHGTRDAVSYMLANLFDESACPGRFEQPWLDCIAGMLESVLENRQLFSNLYQSIGHDQIQEISYRSLFSKAYDQFENETSHLHLADKDRAFIKSFFVNAVIGVCFDWIEGGMQDMEIDSVVWRCGIALQSSVMNTVEAFGKQDLDPA